MPAEERLVRRQLPTAPASQMLTTRVGLKFPTVFTYDKWEEAGFQIARIADSSAWCLGDWLVYGQEQYADRYTTAIEAAGLDYQTLRNYAWVARRFEMWRRHDRLSFQHHAEVAALRPEDQDAWLERAEQHQWSRNELRRQLKSSRDRAAGTGSELATLPRLAVPPDRVRRWREAADQSSSRFDQWVVEALDRAAVETLDAVGPGGPGDGPEPG